MKPSGFRLPLLPALSCVLLAPVLTAQTTIQVFSPVNVRQSLSTATFATPVFFNTANLSLTCPANGVTATLSGPGTSNGAGGDLLVDNNIIVSVTPAGGAASSPANVCVGGVLGDPSQGLYQQHCFNTWYENTASSGSLNGQDPDTFAATGGVAPLDISSQLVPGATQNVTIQLADEGYYVTSTYLYLQTNCTQNGVTGPAQVNGNPIPAGDPDAPTLNQSFNFNSTTNNLVGLVYDLSGAANSPDGTLTITPGTIPTTTDQPLTEAQFKSVYRPYTSFATSECLIHYGELDASGKAACKLYTLECSVGTDPTSAGSLCPASTIPNEVIKDIFDGPKFTLHDIHTPRNGTFHEGFGMLMASDNWFGAGGICTFDPASGLNAPCPQNILNSFTGPGTNPATGQTTHPNSTFITLGQVPEARTSVRVDGELPDHWVNQSNVTVRFRSVPPYLYDLRGTLPGADTYIAQPIKSITYGISAPGSVPNPVSEPIATDSVLSNGTCPIPTSANPGNPAAEQPAFDPQPVSVSFPADGKYILHYYAQDCAGTQDLDFETIAGSWITNFRTREINIDTTKPVVAAPVLSPSGGTYTRGQRVIVSYSCSDATTGSGVVFCGESFYPPATTYSTGTLNSRLDTSSKGSQKFPIYAVDGAGNYSVAWITYKVK